MQRFTEKDLVVLSLIEGHQTYEEMADEMGLSAKSGLYRRVQKLIDLGLVKKDQLKSRSRRLTAYGRRVLSGESPAPGPTASK